MAIDLSSLSRLGYRPAEAVEDVQSETGVDGGFTELLKGFRIFEDVDESTVSGILSRSRVRHFPAGTTVLAEHDACNDEAYVIMGGAVEVSIAGDAFTVLRKGSLFGEYALIAGGERTATIRALEPTECLVLDENACLEISHQSGLINEIMLKRIEENVEKGRGVFAE